MKDENLNNKNKNNNNKNYSYINNQRESLTNIKLTKKYNFIPNSFLFQTILKNTNIDKVIINEPNSELFYETLNGIGEANFNNINYIGNIKYGILDSRIMKSSIKLKRTHSQEKSKKLNKSNLSLLEKNSSMISNNKSKNKNKNNNKIKLTR